MEPCVPLPIDEDVLQDVVGKAKDWAVMHGVGMRYKSNYDRDGLMFAPFLLLPSTFPRKEFEKAIRIQPVINELMHHVAYDDEFLSQVLKNTVEVDEFTSKLYQIYKTVRKEGIAQPLSLGMVRSDIMLDRGLGMGTCCTQCSSNDCVPYCCWKQIEVNTIASGFGWLGPVSGLLHRYILQELGHKDKVENIPENNALQGLAGGMLEAWRIYNNPKAVIMFVIEDVTYNICDQRFHEFEIREQNPDVWVIRKTLTEIGKTGKLTENRALIVDGKEVAVVYYRAGYDPSFYPTQLEWDARLMVERSLALKSPSIQYHLAGTKKVQQELARPGMLEKFIRDPQKVERIRDIFTGLYSLDNDEQGEKAVTMALKNPGWYVMKPQREGGGNNVYGEDILSFLTKVKNSKERSAWILMDKINPPLQKNYILRPGTPIQMSEVISELGIFGVIIGDKEKIVWNQQSGHMLRTKLCSANEGGVSSGLGALDSVFLVDLEKSCSAGGCKC